MNDAERRFLPLEFGEERMSGDCDALSYPRQDDGWSCEVFIPFSCLKGFPGLQLPEGTAAVFTVVTADGLHFPTKPVFPE